MAAAIVSTDAVNKNQLDTGLSGKLSTSTTLDQIAKPVSVVDMNGQRLSNLGRGVDNNDVVTVDQLEQRVGNTQVENDDDGGTSCLSAATGALAGAIAGAVSGGIASYFGTGGGSGFIASIGSAVAGAGGAIANTVA